MWKACFAGLYISRCVPTRVWQAQMLGILAGMNQKDRFVFYTVVHTPVVALVTGCRKLWILRSCSPFPTSSTFFFPEIKESQSDQRTMHPPHPDRAKRKSCSTSAANGVDPSAPRTPGNSSIDVATARATVHDKMEPHLNLHACSALLLINEVSPRALARAN